MSGDCTNPTSGCAYNKYDTDNNNEYEWQQKVINGKAHNKYGNCHQVETVIQWKLMTCFLRSFFLLLLLHGRFTVAILIFHVETSDGSLTFLL